MDSPFVRFPEEDGYQQSLAALVAEVRRRSTLPTLIATDLLCLAESLGPLYFVSNHPYWAKEFHFEARVRDHEGLFTGWGNVDLFIRRVSDRAK